ncbi:MAG: hypothetical protein IT175_02565 [Acidobacteria bacterium]|nr:hypothetical protein [Acidobacteriota bacterium]
MKLYTVEFDGDVPRIEEGVAIVTSGGHPAADLGVDVGGQTLAMVPLRIPLDGLDAPAGGRLLEAEVVSNEDGALRFCPSRAGGEAFVVLSVIQRSPDARTEVEPFGTGVACVGNAFARPMDRQLLTMQPGSAVRVRRFGRGTPFGPWFGLSWSGSELSCSEEENP